MKLMAGPVLKKLGTEWYWFAEGPATTDPTKAVGGPYATRAAAKWARLERLEARFTPDQKSLWAQCCDRAGADVDILDTVAAMIRRGQASPMHILRCAGLPKQDWRDGR